jgi:hypothetical protein
LLDQATGTNWQWLPLVGPDFPLHSYAQRGPLIAWTPHLAGVALKVEGKTSEDKLEQLSRSGRGSRLALWGMFLLLCGLLAANLWSSLTLHHSLTGVSRSTEATADKTNSLSSHHEDQMRAEESGRDRVVSALHDLLIERGGNRQWERANERLLARYERLVRTHKDLRVRDDRVQDKITIAAIGVLAERSADRIEEEVRLALRKQMFNDRLIKAVCDQIHDHFTAESNEAP